MMEFTDHFFYLHNVHNVSVVNYTINNKDCVIFMVIHYLRSTPGMYYPWSYYTI